MRKKVKVKLEDGTIIERVPKATQLGNFVMLTIRYKNDEYHIGDGDEYLRGMPEVFEIGRKVKR